MGNVIPYTILGAFVYSHSQKYKHSIELYHGTSESNVKSIKQNGFRRSTEGSLGSAIYFANYDKAERIAKLFNTGVVLKCKVSYNSIKYQNQNFEHNDDAWQRDGYDIVKVNQTNMSHYPEWAVINQDQIEVIEVKKVVNG